LSPPTGDKCVDCMKGVALPTPRPRLALLLLPFLIASCGGGQGSEDAAPAPTGSLTGLYESGNGARRNQICMIERDGRPASFGFIVWGEDDRNCSASGVVRREGDRLRLLLDGEESCQIEARIKGDRMIFPDTIQAQCARYYCGRGEAMEKAEFAKAGGSEYDARRATDLVGAPLCGG